MSYKYWVYAPYTLDKKQKGDDTIINGGKTLIKLINIKHINQCSPNVLEHKSDGTKILANTKKDDVVYVTGHGNQYYVGSEDDRVSLDPKDLAAQLRNDGLHKEVKKVKVSTCNSGSDGDWNEKTYQNDLCYAQNLCIELAKLGQHENTLVCGYPGEIKTTEKNRTWVDDPDLNGTQMKGGEYKYMFAGKKGNEKFKD